MLFIVGFFYAVRTSFRRLSTFDSGSLCFYREVV